ncbi:MAG TPA: LLM class flavin-dependent oxidoreductase [Candidatus Limnocylindrales bacterium]|nr:LLM class flavin-dependent oxidoreductase [Candidatus Limnocylindrales bacterium]
MRIGFKTSPQAVDWSVLDATWALAGTLDVFDSGWLNDHLSDVRQSRHGPSYEPITLAAALAHHVPGRDIGFAVLSNTFRHPAVLAKQATVLDAVTGGRLLLGLGAGWHVGEHETFGIPLPPIGERIDRLISAVEVLKALFSPEAAAPPGVSRQDPFYPLVEATNEPPPVRPGGPPIYLGGQKPRGIALAARRGDGWLLPGVNVGDVDYFSARRDELLRAMQRVGRDPSGFAFVGQVAAGSSAADHRSAVEVARAMARAGATEVIVALDPASGPDGLAIAAREVAEPIREAVGGAA